MQQVHLILHRRDNLRLRGRLLRHRSEIAISAARQGGKRRRLRQRISQACFDHLPNLLPLSVWSSLPVGVIAALAAAIATATPRVDHRREIAISALVGVDCHQA